MLLATVAAIEFASAEERSSPTLDREISLALRIRDSLTGLAVSRAEAVRAPAGSAASEPGEPELLVRAPGYRVLSLPRSVFTNARQGATRPLGPTTVWLDPDSPPAGAGSSSPPGRETGPRRRKGRARASPSPRPYDLDEATGHPPRISGKRPAGKQEASAEPPRRRCAPTWARLIAKVYQVDPLLCTRCGQKIQMIAFLTDELSIRRILDHLGLSAPPQDKPPPGREILRVAEHGESWGVPAEGE